MRSRSRVLPAACGGKGKLTEPVLAVMVREIGAAPPTSSVSAVSLPAPEWPGRTVRTDVWPASGRGGSSVASAIHELAVWLPASRTKQGIPASPWAWPDALNPCQGNAWPSVRMWISRSRDFESCRTAVAIAAASSSRELSCPQDWVLMAAITASRSAVGFSKSARAGLPARMTQTRSPSSSALISAIAASLTRSQALVPPSSAPMLNETSRTMAISRRARPSQSPPCELRSTGMVKAKTSAAISAVRSSHSSRCSILIRRDDRCCAIRKNRSVGNGITSRFRCFSKCSISGKAIARPAQRNIGWRKVRSMDELGMEN